MADIALDKPQFKIITHSKTGKRRGRVYFPGLYIAENIEELKTWLKQNKIYFTQSDVKLYEDGSFRLFFEASETEYEYLQNKWK